MNNQIKTLPSIDGIEGSGLSFKLSERNQSHGSLQSAQDHNVNEEDLKPVTLTLKLPTYDIMNIELSLVPGFTGLELKTFINKQMLTRGHPGITPSRMRLLLGRKEILDDDKLHECGIDSNCKQMLDVVLRFKPSYQDSANNLQNAFEGSGNMDCMSMTERFEYGNFLRKSQPPHNTLNVPVDSEIRLVFGPHSSGAHLVFSAMLDHSEWVPYLQSLGGLTPGSSTSDHPSPKQMLNKCTDEDSQESRVHDMPVLAAWGDMARFYDGNLHSAKERGFVKWVNMQFTQRLFLVEAAKDLEQRQPLRKEGKAAEMNVNQAEDDISLSSGMQSVGSWDPAANHTEKKQLTARNFLIDQIRYNWRGINRGYCGGDIHSWQRYTNVMPIDVKIDILLIPPFDRLRATEKTFEEPPFLQQLFNYVPPPQSTFDTFTYSYTSKPNQNMDSSSSKEEKSAVLRLQPVQHPGNFPTRAELLGLGLGGGQRKVPVWPSRLTEPLSSSFQMPHILPDTPVHPLNALSAIDDHGEVEVVIRPIGPLKYDTDYFVVLCNGVPVLPAGDSAASSFGFAVAGQVCDDCVLHFRTCPAPPVLTRSEQLEQRRLMIQNQRQAAQQIAKVDQVWVDLNAVDWNSLNEWTAPLHEKERT